MITLYELYWSHYCEKIRWALNFKKLNWKKVNINAFTKKEMKKFPCQQRRYLVPLIYDEKTKTAMGESSSILQYLEESYPESPTLFPKDKADRKIVNDLLIEFDSKLAVISRRLGYTQLILEKPVILSRLFLSDIANGFFNLPGVRRISSAILGMLLIRRFRFELNESLFLYEELENYLLKISENLKTKKFLVADQLTAADLTLAVYLRPLTIVPFFTDNPTLVNLFEWRKNLIKEYEGEGKFLYEEFIEQHRKIHPPVRRKIRNQSNSLFLDHIENEVQKSQVPYNDHNTIWSWDLLRVPYYYFFKIKKNKLRQQFASETVR
jgi:glutathione S-transferase